MACAINRNKQGDIIDVTDKYGFSSELFNQLNASLSNSDVALVAYLKATEKAEGISLKEEPKFENDLVQDIIKEVDSNYVYYHSLGRDLKYREADQKLQHSLTNFLSEIGVDINVVNTITDDEGNTINATGAADLTNRVVQVVNGNSDISTLTEEATHFLVEILRSAESPLYNSMYNLIEEYQEYRDMLDPNNFYYNKYDGNIDLLKREAIAKVVTKIIIDKNTGGEVKEKVSRLERWWNRVLAFLRKMTGKIKTDPFVESSFIIMNNDLAETIKADPSNVALSGTFYQASKQEAIDKKLKEHEKYWEESEIVIDDFSDKDAKAYFIKVAGKDKTIIRYAGKPDGPYAGVTRVKRGSDAGSIRFNKFKSPTEISEEDSLRNEANGKVYTEMGTKTHRVMELYTQKLMQGKKGIDVEGTIGAAYTKSQLAAMKGSVQFIKKAADDIQKQINKENGTDLTYKVYTEQFVDHPDGNLSGTIDLLIIYSDGSASIYDYKSKSPKFGRGAKSTAKFKGSSVEIIGDMFANSMDDYDFQIGNYASALGSNYGVTRIRHSRVVPISVVYKYNKDTGLLSPIIEDLQVYSGGGNDSQLLRHKPVADEMTGDTDIDELIITEIGRHRMLKQKLDNASGQDYDALKTRVATSRRIIEDLQLDSRVSSGLVESNRIRKTALRGLSETEEYTDEKGTKVYNEKYLSTKEITEMLSELKHFQGFSSLPDIINKLSNSKKDSHKKMLEDMKSTAFGIGAVIKQLESKLLERMDNKAKERGIKNFQYNRAGSIVNKFLPAGAVTDPYSGYIHEVVQAIKGKMIRYEKQLHEEIYKHESALRRYAEEKGITLRAAYEELIDPTTHKLHSKFTRDFYEDRRAAREKGDIKWYKEHHEINEKRYKEKFPLWKKNAFARISKDFAGNKTVIAKEKEKWLQRYDVKRVDGKAWLDTGGNQFLRKNPTTTAKYISQSYRKITAEPALKSFYDFHQEKIKEFGDRYGKNLGSTFIPNVHKSLVDSLLEGGNRFTTLTDSIRDTLQVREHDLQFGVVDLEGNFIRQIPRLFVAPLKNNKKEVDPTLRSTELGRSLYLLGAASMEYELKTEVEDELLAIEMLLNQTKKLKEVSEDISGKTVKKGFNSVRTSITGTKTNAAKFTDMVDSAIYGRSLKTKDTELAGLSSNKTLLALKSYATIQALGLKTPVALGALGAGTISLDIQASKSIHYTRGQLRTAQKMIVGRDPKVRAIMEHYETTVVDMSKRRGDKLASNMRAKYMTEDRWFEFLAQADNLIDSSLTVAMLQNHGVDEKGNLKRIKELPEGTKSLFDSFEYEDNKAWEKHSGLSKYKAKVPNETDATFDQFRARVARMSSKVKGTGANSDIVTSQMEMGWRFMLQYRSWLPNIAFERFGALRQDRVMDHWDQGTWKSLWSNIGPKKEFNSLDQIVSNEIAFTEILGSYAYDLIKVGVDVGTFGMVGAFALNEPNARSEFDAHVLDNVGNEQYTWTEEEKAGEYQKFLEMKRGNIKAHISELRSVFLFFIALRLAGADWDEDGKIDIRQSYSGRKIDNLLNRIYRELAIFTDPTELTGPRSSGLPILTLGAQFIRWVDNTFDEIGDTFFGENVGGDKVERWHYTFQWLPPAGGIAKWLEADKQYKYSK